MNNREDLDSVQQYLNNDNENNNNINRTVDETNLSSVKTDQTIIIVHYQNNNSNNKNKTNCSTGGENGTSIVIF